MVLIPLVVAQMIMANVFFSNHWDRVHASMARSLSGEIAAMLNLMDGTKITPAVGQMAKDIGINVTVNQNLLRPKRDDNKSVETGMLAVELQKMVKSPAKLYIDRKNRLLFVDIPRNDKTITFATSLRRVYSTSTEVFIIWLAGSILIVSVLIAPFIIMHTRSIRRISKAAGMFGRGLDMPGFKPGGSREIREAGNALLIMKERLNRYNRTRTDMLNAVSHDLKSPLSRMRIGIESGTTETKDLLREIDRLAEMINGYLAFARGDMPEIEQEVQLPPMLTRIARDAADDKEIVLNFPEKPVMFYARPLGLARAFQNVIDNAAKYAKSKIEITEKDSDELIEVTIDDDGAGIPEDRRADAMRPFVKLDQSRAADSGGTGLGLSIAQTAIENHGGQLFLEDSPLGGLRVRIVLPV